MASKKGKILIVDDNAGIRQALKILLPLHFEEVEAIPSPSTLVYTLEHFRPVKKAIVLEDLMRRVIGLSLARQIMRQHSGSIDLVKSDVNETVFQMVFR